MLCTAGKSPVKPIVNLLRGSKCFASYSFASVVLRGYYKLMDEYGGQR